jgi:uncharacterized iron-regulated protein
MSALVSVKILKQCLQVMLLGVFFLLSSVTAKGPAIGWQAPFFQDHPLVGKIWDTHKNDWVSAEKFEYELLHYDYILLGEAHNNPDHHSLQAEVINALVSSGKKPSVVMEMLSQQSWQDQPLRWNKLFELQTRAEMLNEGWPWSLYEPILTAVVQHQLELFAGNISSEELHRWANDKGDDEENDVASEYAYSAENFATLKKNIIAFHCGHANQGFVSFMSRAQMQRDNVMVSSLINKDLPVVFIVGSGHVRNDYAVPMQLRRKYKQSSYLSVAFIAVQEGKDNPQDYLQELPGLYDILYFTPSHTNEDPCVKFRKQLQNMQPKTHKDL